MEWLKGNFISKAFLNENFDGIEAVLRNASLQSLGFDNSKVNASYDQLLAALQAFADTTLMYMWLDPPSPWLRVPPEWDYKRFDNATNEIDEARDRLVESYDNFLAVAHKKGIDQ